MKVTITLIAIAFIASCGNKTEKDTLPKKDSILVDLVKEPSQLERLKIIKTYEDSMYASGTLNPRIGKAAIKAYTDYQRIYWQDTLCADFLFKAAEIADNMDNPNKAIELYKECYNNYTQYIFKIECLFRIANIYELKLNDYANAKQYYRDVITYYPKSSLAKDAETAIKNMGKPDDELIREFEKKNGVKK